MKKMFQTMWLLGVLVLIAACGDHSRFKYESVQRTIRQRRPGWPTILST